MTKRQKLIKFLKMKDSLITEAQEAASNTPVEYFTKEDEEDIKRWSWQDVAVVWKSLLSLNPWTAKDSDHCPWCVINKDRFGVSDCTECTYGHRHGNCKGYDAEPSDYQTICLHVENANEGISDITGVQELLESLQKW